MTRLKCPVSNCQKDTSNIARLWDHFRGTHVNNSDFINLIKLISESPKIDKQTQKALIQRIQGYIFEQPSNDDVMILLNDSEPQDRLINEIFSLNDYFKTTKPVCREERQYALFFANYLKSDDPDFNNQLGFNKHNVLEVYYEATFMRDFWFQNKEKFNRALWEYLADREFEFANKTYEDTEKHPNHWGKSMKHPLASWMMNAKPDVAVLLKQKESYKLYFLECKYMTDIDVYTNPSTSIVKNQTVIQKDILDFLCNKIKLQYNGKKIIKGDVKLVRFTLKESKPIKDKHNQISVAIEDLIKYGYK